MALDMQAFSICGKFDAISASMFGLKTSCCN